VEDERTPAENLAKALTCGLCPAKTDPAFVEALVAVAYLSNKRVSSVKDWLVTTDTVESKAKLRLSEELEEYVRLKLQVPSSGASFLCVLRGPAKRLFLTSVCLWLPFAQPWPPALLLQVPV
jgi:hypothetical protein